MRKRNKRPEATHAVVSFAAHDLNGFAALGRIAVEQYRAAPEGPRDIDGNHSIVLDLWSREGHFDDKFVSLDTAAGLLGWPRETLIQRGRQAVAQHQDELTGALRQGGWPRIAFEVSP